MEELKGLILSVGDAEEGSSEADRELVAEPLLGGMLGIKLQKRSLGVRDSGIIPAAPVQPLRPGQAVSDDGRETRETSLFAAP